MSGVVEEKQIAIPDEKQTTAKSSTEISKHSSENTPTTTTGKDLDQAYVFLSEHNNNGDENINLKALRRKIDWRIIPLMFLCYVMQFVDKVMINYANVMGMSKDLKFKGNDFSNVGSSFFIAYLIAEIPTGFILQKVGVAKWLGINVVLWGIATACHAAATSYTTMLVCRIFLGIFEAAIAPCLMLLSSQWYTRSEQAPRFSFWYCGLGVGQIFGGIVSYGFQQVRGEALAGWRIMFIFMGILTILIGVATFVVIPDTPMQAKWLSDNEKTELLRHVSGNLTGVSNSHFKLSHLGELLSDIQIWLMILITVLISISSGVISTYSATLIRGLKFTGPQSALLNMPGGIISIASTLIVGFGVRHTSHRWAWLAGCCIPGMIGGALMSFLPNTNKAGILIGIYLVNSIVATLAIIYQWTVANLAGHTKRTMGSSIIAGAFSIGNIVGPQTFQAKDAATGYRPAKITVLATQGAGALMALVLFLYYFYANKKKDQREGQTSDTEENKWENKTDKENKTFRYVY